ncbi:MAG: T9SS type A sorting domain-containing protein, partial [Gloeobacteraceae cyanobacterium ES-bin-316]|nr:T9SS type A sorting domain-containing protein [Ferruginibacter sp.]
TTVSIQAQFTVSDSVPVRLSTLDARLVSNGARLDWKVVCFLSFAKFEIQRSVDGRNYTTIHSFEADQLRCREPFDYTDGNINGRAFYRLKVGDPDGRVYNSKIVAVSGKETGFELNSLTPSLVSNQTTISISSAAAGKGAITILNLQGNIVKSIGLNLNKGVTETLLDLSGLAKGNYILRLSNGSSETRIIRFSKL